MRAPRVAYVTAGAAGMFCGSCMRDNTLASALLRLGTEITLVPTFTPIRTEEDDVSLDRVFLGGINVYLEEKWPALRHLPRAVRRVLDHPRLLRALSTLSLEPRRADDSFERVDLPGRSSKFQFLSEIDLLSVPTVYREPKGDPTRLLDRAFASMTR